MSLRSINNFSLQTFRDYFAVSGKDAQNEYVAAMKATGGNVISEFTEGSTVYRAHIFTGSGELTITEGTESGQYLIVAGGGAGGGGYYSGGGGAGGYVTNDPSDPRYNSQTLSLEPGPYSIIVGAGGAPSGNTALHKNPGSPSVAFGHTAYGGGAGGQPGSTGGDNGGCGGGGVYSAGPPGAGSKITGTATDSPPQGWPGGSGSPGGGAGGGGTYLSGISTAGIGITASTPHAPIGNVSRGGQGQPSSFSGIATHYAAGGSGGLVSGPSTTIFSDRASGIGGRGALNHSPLTAAPQTEMAGVINTGSGGGGTDRRATDYVGSGSGASGVVIVRYSIGSVQNAKATGGNVSYTPTHTIHAFMQSGTFTTPAAFSETVEYVVVGGGGAGGCTQGGGGGAGGYRTGTTPIAASQTCPIIIGIGGIADLLYQDTTIDDLARGTETTFGAPAGSIISRGGGGGAQYGGNGQDSGPSSGSGGGNSGGAGSAGTGNGSPFPGTIGASPANGWGHNGGSSASNQGGGGGGAGSVGGDSPTTAGGNGGEGIQVPTTFRHPFVSLGTGPTSPTVTGGDTTGRYWLAGGGGGGSIDSDGAGGYGGGGGTDTIGYAGGGNGNNTLGANPAPEPYNGTPGVDGTGGGGGGGGRSGTSNPGPSRGGSGGSGIVLLAYPT